MTSNKENKKLAQASQYYVLDIETPKDDNYSYSIRCARSSIEKAKWMCRDDKVTWVEKETWEGREKTLIGVTEGVPVIAIMHGVKERFDPSGFDSMGTNFDWVDAVLCCLEEDYKQDDDEEDE